MAGEANTEVVELMVLNEPPLSVTGDRAFVIYQNDVGRVEVVDPKTNCPVWSYRSGDLMHTVVHATNGRIAEGGGDT